jgi:hypothetical protein
VVPMRLEAATHQKKGKHVRTCELPFWSYAEAVVVQAVGTWVSLIRVGAERRALCLPRLRWRMRRSSREPQGPLGSEALPEPRPRPGVQLARSPASHRSRSSRMKRNGPLAPPMRTDGMRPVLAALYSHVRDTPSMRATSAGRRSGSVIRLMPYGRGGAIAPAPWPSRGGEAGDGCSAAASRSLPSIGVEGSGLVICECRGGAEPTERLSKSGPWR